MDETKTAAPGAEQGKSSAAPSDGKAGTTPAPQTFTQSDVDKAISDALAKAGRTDKALRDREAALTPREKAIQEAEARRQQEAQAKEDAELDAVAKEAPEAEREKTKATLKAYKDKLRQEKADFEALRVKHSPILATLEELGITDAAALKATVEATRATQLNADISEAATAAGVAPEVLKERALKLGITGKDKLAVLAEGLPKITAIPPADSGKNVGGESTANLSPREWIARGIEKIK